MTFLAAMPGHAAAAAAALILMRSATASMLDFLAVPRAVNTKAPGAAGVLALPEPQCGDGGRLERAHPCTASKLSHGVWPGLHEIS